MGRHLYSKRILGLTFHDLPTERSRLFHKMIRATKMADLANLYYIPYFGHMIGPFTECLEEIKDNLFHEEVNINY